MARIDSTKTGQGRLGYYHTRIEDEATGTVKYSMRLMSKDKMDGPYINEWASNFTGTSEAQMEVAFAALAKAIQYFTLNGHSITLEGLGTLSFSTKSGIWDALQQKWTSAGKEGMSAVSTDDIRSLHIRFRLASRLRKLLGTSEFFNVVATTQGWDTLTHYKEKPDVPTINVSGQTVTFLANIADPPGTPLNYSLDNGTTWQAYTEPFTLEDGGTVKARATAGNGKHSDIATANVPHG